jgi:hypothetical protein
VSNAKNTAALRNSFETGGDVDAIAVKIISLDDDIAKMHTDAERYRRGP